MKKLLSLFLSVLILFSAFPMTAQAFTIEAEQAKQAEMTADAFAKTADSSQPMDNLFNFDRNLPKYDWGDLKPAKLSGVTYKLADDVVKVNPDVTSSIKSAEQISNPINTQNSTSVDEIINKRGYLDVNKLKSSTGLSNIKPNTTFVDLKNNISFKVPALPAQTGDEFQNYVPVVKPEFREVLKDFKIPKQRVVLNKANISNFANDTDKYLKKPGQTHIMSQDTKKEPMDTIGPTHLKDPLAEFYFPKDTTVKGSTPSGGQVAVTVNGYLGIGDMALNGDYDWDGYEFYFSVAEEMQLQVTVAATLKEEIRIPILGVDIGSNSDVGSIAGGLFLVVGINGEFTLQMEARQWTTIAKAGLKGKNFLGIPYTIRPLFTLGDSGFNLDSSFNGAVDGYIKGGALLEIKLFGLDLVGAGVFAGMGASSIVDGENIETDLYGLLQAYIKFIGKHKNIVNWQPTIMHKQQRNTAGYQINYKEACAYRDEVWGNVKYDYGVTGLRPEPDKDFVLLVQDLKGSEHEYPGKTDADGNFHLSNVDLHKDYQVCIRLKEKNGENYVKSEAITPTFPFKKVILLESDFFNDYVKGYVPTVIVKDWTTGLEKEINFELNKGPESSISIKLDSLGKEYPVTVDDKGIFTLTSVNILPQEKATCQLTYDDFVVNSNAITPSVEFQATVNRIPVSYTKTTENGKPVDVTKVSETISIMNMRGTKQYVGNASHTVSGYTQASTLCFITNPDTGLPLLKAFGLPEQTQSVKISAISDPAQEEYGTSHFTNTIVKKWFWEPKPAVRNRLSIKSSVTGAPTTENQNRPSNSSNNRRPDNSLNNNLLKKLTGFPQRTFTLSFDDQFDKYEDYYDNYSEWVDGTRHLMWNDKIVFQYEGVDITVEYKDVYEEGEHDSKFETLPADMLSWDRYLDRMMGSVVMPMPDEMNMNMLNK